MTIVFEEKSPRPHLSKLAPPLSCFKALQGQKDHRKPDNIALSPAFSFLPLSSLVVYSLVSCHSDFHPREPHGHTDGSSAAADRRLIPPWFGRPACAHGSAPAARVGDPMSLPNRGGSTT